MIETWEGGPELLCLHGEQLQDTLVGLLEQQRRKDRGVLQGYSRLQGGASGEGIEEASQLFGEGLAHAVIVLMMLTQS